MGNPASPLSARASSGHCVTPSPYSRCTVAAPGTEEAPEVFLLEDVALDVPEGGDDLVDGDLVLVVQGAPHPRRLDSWLEVRLLLGDPILNVLNCKTDIGQS